MTNTLHRRHIDQHQDQGGDRDGERAAVDPVMARLRFDAAVDQLTVPATTMITRDDGSREQASAACLLDQLDQACAPGGERSGSSSPGSRPPASLNALTVVAEISGVLRRELASLGHHMSGHARRPLSTQAKLWASHAEHWQYNDPDFLDHAAALAEHWVTATRGVLEPAPRYPLRGHTCPVCRETTVVSWSDVECDWVRRPALSIDTDRVDAVCAACDTRWGLDVWTQLGALLDNQRKETLAMDCE